MPTPISARVATSIIQRWWMAKRTIFSSRPPSLKRGSVLMRSPFLFDVGLDQVALLDHDLIALRQPRQDFHALAVSLADLYRLRLAHLADAAEHHLLTITASQRRQRHHQLDGLLFDRDPPLERSRKRGVEGERGSVSVEL